MMSGLTSTRTGLGGLWARTTLVRPEQDLIAAAGPTGQLFARSGWGRAGRGQAGVIHLPGGMADVSALAGVTRKLKTIPHQLAPGSEILADRPGAGPVAMGALAFEPGRPGRLVVPSWSLAIDPDGLAWVTVVGTGDGAEPSPSPSDDGPWSEDQQVWAPDRFSLTSPISHEEWCTIVAKAISEIDVGRVSKVVLARQVVVEANRPIKPMQVAARLQALYPSCTTFHVDGFIGASPELLVSRRHSLVRSQPLAGTVARTGHGPTDAAGESALLASPKERSEHAMVVDAVARVLADWCRPLTVPDSPSIVELRNVSHLGSTIEGTLKDPLGGPSALALAGLLHPTPAVAGTPRSEALNLIAELEGFDRGRFAGPVGWVDGSGNGEWVVGIRSAALEGCRARLFAGVGIVAGSQPRLELAETQLKLQSLLAAVVRP